MCIQHILILVVFIGILGVYKGDICDVYKMVYRVPPV